MVLHRLLPACIGLTLLAGCSESAPDGRVLEVRGEVTLDGNPLLAGKIIPLEGRLVAKEGRAIVALPGAGTVRVFPHSELRFGAPPQGFRLRLWAGKVWAKVTELGEGRQFEVVTDNASAGVRGTEYVVEVENDETDVRVMAGEVEVRGQGGGPRRVRARQRVKVRADEAPSEPTRYNSLEDTRLWKSLERALKEVGRGVKEGGKGVGKEIRKGAKEVGRGLKRGARELGKEVKDLFK